MGAAAYRSGATLTSERDGMVHDYSGRRSRGEVTMTRLLLPDGKDGVIELGGEIDKVRGGLWNKAEAAERRGDACVAREYEVALPAELNERDRRVLALEFGRELVRRYGVAVDVAIHEPSRDGDRRNYHVHYLTTTRGVSLIDTNPVFGAKTRILDARRTGPAEVEALRALWAIRINAELERIGSEARIDHRSHARRGLAAIPGIHVSVSAMAMERRAQREHAEGGGLDVLAPVTDRGGQQAEIVALNTQMTLLREEMAGTIAELAELERLAEAERAPEPPRPPPSFPLPAVEGQDADGARWRSLPLGELQREVERLRPPPPEVAAEFTSEVQVERAAVGKALMAAHRATAPVERVEAAVRLLDQEIEGLRAEAAEADAGVFGRPGGWLSGEGARRQAVLAERERALAEERRRQAAAVDTAARRHAEAEVAKARERAAIEAALPAAEAELRPLWARYEAAAAVLRQRQERARVEARDRYVEHLASLMEQAETNQRRVREREAAADGRKRQEAEEWERRQAERDRTAASAEADPSELEALDGDEDGLTSDDDWMRP